MANSQKSLSTKQYRRKDPLQGAPGHAPGADEAIEPVDAPKAKATVRPAAKSDSSSPWSEEIMASLGSALSSENMAKLRELVSTNAADAEAKVASFIDSVKASLPEDFSIADLIPKRLKSVKAPKKKVAGASRTRSSAKKMASAKSKPRSAGKAAGKAKKVAGKKPLNSQKRRSAK